jgi:uncharacterized RDD family membrane protein YckC
MLYEDRMAVATPEGVTLEFTLAGVGSRFLAGLVDLLIQGGLIIGIWLLSAGMSAAIGEFAAAFGIVATFVVLVGYDVAFETLGSGRTLGKRWTGLRVVRIGGAPITFVPSAIRNLLRLVDLLPSAYLIGIVCILATPRNQRLGDLAAGTIVVRERKLRHEHTGWMGYAADSGQARGIDVSTWDASAVTAEEIATVREFLARRNAITSEARARLAMQLAGRLRPKVVGPDDRIGPETFLEFLVAAKSDRA